MPSGLTSMSSASRRCCRIADTSGVNADVPSPWNDCVQSIGLPFPFPLSCCCGVVDAASGSGVPDTAGTGVRGVGFDVDVEVGVEAEVVGVALDAGEVVALLLLRGE